MCAACSVHLRLTLQLSLKAPDRPRCCQAHRQSPSPRHLRKRTRSQGPLLRRRYPASTLIRPCPTPVMADAFRNVEAATLATVGSPPITRSTFPTCRAHYPGGSSWCACRLLPRSRGLPQMGRRLGIRIVTFEALLRLHSRYGPPDRSAAPRRPLSRGSDPCGYPHEPLVQRPRRRAAEQVENAFPGFERWLAADRLREETPNTGRQHD